MSLLSFFRREREAVEDILGDFHRLIDRLEQSRDKAQQKFAEHEGKIAELQQEQDHLSEQSSRADVVAAKLKELISA